MLNAPNLKYIGGDLNVMGNIDVNESHFPSLETIEGDLITANSGFTKLPPKLKKPILQLKQLKKGELPMD